MNALGVLTDGRADYLADTIEAAAKHLPQFDAKYIVNDSGDVDYQSWLRCNYPEFKVVFHDERRGMAGAVRSMWETACDLGAKYLFHLEDDMVLLRDTPVAVACEILAQDPRLAQVVFKRHPWSGREVDLGDQLAAIVEAASCSRETAGLTYHNHLFSLNPCVIPYRTFSREWPDGNERGMTDQLLADHQLFAMYGHVGDDPYVRHIGSARADGWRL